MNNSSGLKVIVSNGFNRYPLSRVAAEMHKRGLKLFPKNDHAALADDLARLLSRPELMASYGTQAAEHLRKHSRRAVAERYLEVFNLALSKSGSRPAR
jgi:glycosyltransferase involved in cell wall biosynthesis